MLAMDQVITLIGYGEAGKAFDIRGDWRAFDRIAERSRAASLAEAMSGADIVLSVVTAGQALAAADAAASCISPDALYCDMNSVSPDTKRTAAKAIEAVGGRYVDVAIMSPVYPAGTAVPLLVSGPHSVNALKALSALGFANVRIVGDDVGRASTIKMLRSVMYKGVEALTAECLIACEKAGVTDEVLDSFANDWSAMADYRLDRIMVHGTRRAAEMCESSQTLLSLGVSPTLTEGTARWQRAMGELAISPVPEGLQAKLAAILEKMP